MSQNVEKQFTQISRSMILKGEINGEGDMRIAGTLNGTLVCKGNLVVEQTGNLEGKFKVDSATIAGKVNGDIECENKLILEATASFTGNIKTKQLVIECGAMFQGKCEMNPNGEQVLS